MERDLTEEMTFETENGTFFCETYHYQELGLSSSIPDGVHIKGYKGEGKDGVLDIPKEINGVPVVAVDGLLEDNNDIEKVVIPETVQTADWIATNCPNLKEVVFSENTKIYDSAIVKCNDLSAETTTALNVANPWAVAHTSECGVVYGRQGNYVAVIGYDPDRDMTNGKAVFVYDEYEGLPVTHIADVAMEGAESVKSLMLPENIHVNGGALKNFSSLEAPFIAGIFESHPDAFGKDLTQPLGKIKEEDTSIAEIMYQRGVTFYQSNEKDKGLNLLVFSAALGYEPAQEELSSMALKGLVLKENDKKLLNEMGVDIGESNRELLDDKKALREIAELSEPSKPWFDKLVGKDDKGKEPKEREEPEIGE